MQHQKSFVVLPLRIFVVCVCRFGKVCHFLLGADMATFLYWEQLLYERHFRWFGFILILSMYTNPIPGPSNSLFVKTEYSSLGVVVERPGGGCTRGKGPAAWKIRTMHLCFTSRICFICKSRAMGTFIVK